MEEKEKKPFPYKILFIVIGIVTLAGLIYFLVDKFKSSDDGLNLSDKDAQRHKKQMDDAKAKEHEIQQGKVSTIKDIKKASLETAKGIMDLDAQAIEKVGKAAGTEPQAVAEYLGLIINMSPKQIKPEAIQTYMQSLALGMKVLETATTAYQNACVEILKATLGSQIELATCENMKIEYKTFQHSESTKSEIHTTTKGEFKTTGLVSLVAGFKGTMSTRKDEFHSSDLNVTEQTPIFKCAQWTVPDDLLITSTATARQAYMMALAGFIKASNRLPSPLSHFGIPEATLKKWIAKWDEE